MNRIACLLVVSLLLGCGGGGGENGDSGSPPIATSLAATSITQTGATLNGTAIPNGLRTQSWFEYGTDSVLSTYSSSTRQDAGNGLASQAATMTWNGLAAGATYYFRFCAENSKGRSIGLIVGFTTSSPGSPPTVTTLPATSVGATAATLNGSITANGLATNAWFEWGTDPALSTYTPTASQPAGSGTSSQLFDSSLSGLSTGTTYYFRAAASNGSGMNKGSIASFTPGAAPAVTTGAAMDVGATNATVTGSVSPNGLTTNSWFEWGTDPALATFGSTQPMIIGSSGNGFARFETLTGLSSGTGYYYRHAASNSSGTSKGAVLGFTTTSPSSFGVVSTSPGNNGTEIPLSSAIKVTFNKDVNPSTVSNGITARSYIGDLPGTVSYDPSTKTATFTPGTPLAPLTGYTVTVNPGVKSVNGEALSAPYITHFTTVTAFRGIDFNSNTYYLMGATKVAEGAHCYIYLENGKTVSQANIDRIRKEFDDNIYPGMLLDFGDEPNPGADGLPKIFIVLLDIRDGNNPGGFISGYFRPTNEYSNVDSYPLGSPSDQKEVLFMDIYPGNPSSPSFDKTLAHEFQHLVHWEQKTNRLGLNDDTWLNEAMSEIAPFYAGYGPDYSRVATFESGNNRSDSLTVWSQGLADYGVAYMWSQYMADRFPHGVFKNILASPSTGIASVNGYLDSAYPGATFSTVFRDWSIAVFSGNEIAWTDHPEWSYKSINTREGIYGGIGIPGVFTPTNLNVSPLPALAPWSVNFYWYTPKSANPTITLNPGPLPRPQASLVDSGNNGWQMDFDMVPGQPYPYDNAAFVVLQNASGSTTSGSSSSNLSIQGSTTPILTPSEKLKAIRESATSNKSGEKPGEPVGICIHDYLLEQEKVMREKLKEKRNVR